MEKPNFDILYTEEAKKFLYSLDEKARNKIIYNIEKSRFLMDSEILKKLTNTEIWEFRTLFNKTQYRILAFWDKREKIEKLVVCVNGFIKKTDKTPKNEIEKAEQLMKKYFETYKS